MQKQILKYKKPLILGLLLAIGLMAYFYRETWIPFFDKSNKDATTSNPSIASITTTSNTTSSSNGEQILAIGSTGEKVKQLQQLLNAKHYEKRPQLLPMLVVDGNFGAKTEFMLEKWTGKKSTTITQLIKDLK